MLLKVEKYRDCDISKEEFLESFQGWNAYAKWANTFKLRKKFMENLNCTIFDNLIISDDKKA